MQIEGIRDTLGKIIHRKPQPVFCPRCGSSDMKYTSNFGMLPAKWRCGVCAYEGVLVIELETDGSTSREVL